MKCCVRKICDNFMQWSSPKVGIVRRDCEFYVVNMTNLISRETRSICPDFSQAGIRLVNDSTLN